MKASETALLEFLKNAPQMVIPIYQRTYSWGERECAQLWTDVLRAGRIPELTSHFVGSVVYVKDGQYSVSSQSPLLVIDGQQRLTTLSLLLEALARHLGDEEPIEGFSAKKIRSYYLQNPLESGDRQFKLVLTQTDKDSLLALVQQREIPQEHSIRLISNFEYFEQQLDLLTEPIEVLCAGINKLMIVDISLNRDHDNPQLIFESMNSTGKVLGQADLIRNFILMGLDPETQTDLYLRYWRPMEIEFGQEAYGSHFDGFMRHFLAVKTGEVAKIGDAYDAFKAYSRRSDVAEAGIEQLVSEIRKFATFYCRMALSKESNKQLAEAFQDIRELRVQPIYPFLLRVYEDYEAGAITADQFEEVVRLAESYVFRRVVCAIPTNSLTRTFAGLHRSIEVGEYLESTKAAMMLLPGYRRFPRDEEFLKDLRTRDLYNNSRKSYWFRRVENHGRKERVSIDEYSIEHIMPQNEKVSEQWQAELGPDWKRIHETKLHVVGNLTLTAYNSEYSDRAFVAKRDMDNGFASSPLNLNKGLGQVSTWNEDAIDKRTGELAQTATHVWKQPSITAEQIEKYREVKAPKGSNYTIADHDRLGEGTVTRALFDEFRTQVLALDDCVYEDFLKLYVAFKAETNFVDVIPKFDSLRLTLNMPFHELIDPQGIAIDITGMGKWGNGDVSVPLKSIGSIPYVIGLVRQSLDRQLASATSE